MTIAWYGHLRHTSRALWAMVLVSWGIAFFEYCLQVPANRYGYEAGLSAAQLKTLQEIITLVVFVIFASLYLREPIRWNVIAGVGIHAERGEESVAHLLKLYAAHDLLHVRQIERILATV